MKKVSVFLLCAVLFAGAWAEEKPQGEMQMPEMGPPAEMKQLESMVGSWDVTMQTRQMADQPWIDTKGTCTYEYILAGAALRQHYEGDMMGMPFNGETTICYNRETKKWQMTWIDNLFGIMSYYEGDWKDDKLIAGNRETWQGMEYLSRMTTYNITEDSFDWMMEMSTDEGKTWFATMKAVYTRSE